MLTVNTDGTMTFRLYAPHAEAVELLADFSGWEHGRLEMRREGENSGWWSVTVDAPEGDHAFCYLVDGKCWMPDYAAHGVKRNEYGNWVSLVTIPAQARSRGATAVAETHALMCVEHADALRESWRIDGCCTAQQPWAG